VSRRSPIHVGETWRHIELKHEGAVTGMFLVQIELEQHIRSVWVVQIAYAIPCETVNDVILYEITTQRWEEHLFLRTHRFMKEAPHEPKLRKQTEPRPAAQP
jgi:hypothetical protein